MRGLNKKEQADCGRRIKRLHAASVVHSKHVLSQPGLKLFEFCIGPYRHLEEEYGTPWLYLFVVAKTKKEAIRLKKESDKRCDPKLSVRGRKHKWFVIPFEVGTVVLV